MCRVFTAVIFAGILAAPARAQEDAPVIGEGAEAVGGESGGTHWGEADKHSGGSGGPLPAGGGGGGSAVGGSDAGGADAGGGCGAEVVNFPARYGGGNHNYLDATPHVIYSFPVPMKDANGVKILGGFVGGTTTTGGTGNMTLEWSISQCPGDFSYYKSEAASVLQSFGARQIKEHPCGAVQGAESNGVGWVTDPKGPTPNAACQVTSAGTWYFNVRAIAGCVQGECKQVFDVITQLAH